MRGAGTGLTTVTLSRPNLTAYATISVEYCQPGMFAEVVGTTRIFRGAAVPFAGTMAVGNLWENTTPVAGGSPGSVYTSDGWKARASLEA